MTILHTFDLSLLLAGFINRRSSHILTNKSVNPCALVLEPHTRHGVLKTLLQVTRGRPRFQQPPGQHLIGHVSSLSLLTCQYRCSWYTSISSVGVFKFSPFTHFLTSTILTLSRLETLKDPLKN